MLARQPQLRQLDIDSPQRQSDHSLIFVNRARFRLELATLWLVLSICAFAFCGLAVCAQSSTPATSQAQPPDAPNPQNPTADPSQQKPGRVTTTVVVHGEVKDDYLSNAASAASLDNTTLRETPLSVTNVTRALMSDQISRLLTDVVKNDASVGEDYAPVGYYGDFQIRGFPIDLATGLQINGMTIAGEQDVPLENKQRVEIVKGIAGLESGVASSGGMISYATSEPNPGQRPTLDLATDQRGTAYGATQFAVPGLHGGSGLLITAAGEDIHTYVEGANGWRGMGAADGRWQLGANTQLMTDFEYQHKVQRSEAGYQLLGGTIVPAPVYPSVMLGFQSWSKPNTFDTLNAGARLERKLATNWTFHLGGSYSHSLIDDNVIWPYGPALDADGNSLCPDSPYYFFCPDGSYEIYDYRSPGELRIDALGEALVLGHFTTGKISHDVVGGASLFHRTVDLSSSAVYAPLGRRERLSTKYLLRSGGSLRTGRPIHARRLRPPALRNRAGARPSPRPRSPSSRWPHRPSHRFQLHRISDLLAAAIWGHLFAGPRSHALRQLRRPSFAWTSGSVVG